MTLAVKPRGDICGLMGKDLPMFDVFNCPDLSWGEGAVAVMTVSGAEPEPDDDDVVDDADNPDDADADAAATSALAC